MDNTVLITSNSQRSSTAKSTTMATGLTRKFQASSPHLWLWIVHIIVTVVWIDDQVRSHCRSICMNAHQLRQTHNDVVKEVRPQKHNYVCSDEKTVMRRAVLTRSESSSNFCTVKSCSSGARMDWNIGIAYTCFLYT